MRGFAQPDDLPTPKPSLCMVESHMFAEQALGWEHQALG